jgi:phosphohistidine phosphatase
LTVPFRPVWTSLWLLRHGEAVPHGSKDDSDRELTPRGEHESRTAGRALARMNVEFDACYASPKVRARDTALLACEPLGIEPVEHEALADGFDGDEALTLMAAAGADQRVLVVGHEPDFSQVVYDMTGGRVDMKKGGIAAVRLDGTRGELIALLRPRELDRIAGA